MEQVRAVLVGTGGISGAWLRACAEIPELEIVGLVDVVEANARRRAEEFNLGEAAIDTDMSVALERLSPDVVFNCTTPGAHRTVTIGALEHGCHVLSEKPLADSMEAAREMVAAAEQADKLFAVIQNRRYDPQIRRLRALVESGELGPLTTVNSDFYLGAHFGDFREDMEHILLLDMAVHTFDAARLITGADPVSVWCKEWNPAGSWYAHDASAVAVFEMAGGVVYTYRGSWCSEGLSTTWESDWRVLGTQGSATWDGAEELRAEKVAKPGGFLSEVASVPIPPFENPAKVGGHEGVIREFVECVRSGGVPETVASDNIKSLAMTLAAMQSAELGTTVAIDTA